MPIKEGERPPKRVVCALIQRSGLVCVTRRVSDGAFPDLWEHPGGKVEGGESDKEALKRELREELGIEVDVAFFLTTRIFRPPVAPEPYLIALYRVVIREGEPKPLVAAELRWVVPDDLWQLRGTPAFREFNEYLQHVNELERPDQPLFSEEP